MGCAGAILANASQTHSGGVERHQLGTDKENDGSITC